MKIIISPFSRRLRNGKINAKNYPYWTEVVQKLHRFEGIETIQIGLSTEQDINCTYNKRDLDFTNLANLVHTCYTWISIDNFFPHFCNHIKAKSGVVIFSKSDPYIFGYPQNINLLKDRSYLRKDQYDIWEDVEFQEESFIQPEIVIKSIEELFDK